MLLPSFVHSAPYVVKKYFILEHLLCLENELLFWSTFLFCPTGCRRQPCTHPSLADVAGKGLPHQVPSTKYIDELLGTVSVHLMKYSILCQSSDGWSQPLHNDYDKCFNK